MSATSRSVRLLSAQDVRAALPMSEAIEAMKGAFLSLTQGQAVMPPRAHIAAERRHGQALFMPAYLAQQDWFGLKVVTLFDDNPANGLPRIQGLVLLVSGQDGSPRAVLDGAALTAIRTGAATGLATSYLAREDAATAAVFGAGVQGRTQLEAVHVVRPLSRVSVFDPDQRQAESFAREMNQQLGVDVERARTATDALRDADIVCAASTARTPIFADEDISPGTHINAIGSYQPEVQEIPVETVARAKVVVDHRDSALDEAGDLLVAIQQGQFAADRIHAELGQLITGVEPGRTSSEEVTFFKSVGVAVQDVAAAARAVARADENNLGTQWML